MKYVGGRVKLTPPKNTLKSSILFMVKIQNPESDSYKGKKNRDSAIDITYSQYNTWLGAHLE